MLNKKTQSELEAAEWARQYALDSGAYQKSWQKTCELAQRGVQWAVQMVIERVAGRVKERIDHEGDMNVHLSFSYANGKTE